MDFFADNQASLKYAHLHVRAGRMKHIDVKFHFTLEKVTAGAISVRFFARRTTRRPSNETSHWLSFSHLP